MPPPISSVPGEFGAQNVSPLRLSCSQLLNWLEFACRDITLPQLFSCQPSSSRVSLFLRGSPQLIASLPPYQHVVDPRSGLMCRKRMNKANGKWIVYVKAVVHGKDADVPTTLDAGPNLRAHAPDFGSGLLQSACCIDDTCCLWHVVILDKSHVGPCGLAGSNKAVETTWGCLRRWVWALWPYVFEKKVFGPL